MVLKYDNYIDYIVSHYENEIKKLKKENIKLKKETNHKTSKLQKYSINFIKVDLKWLKYL